MKKILLSLMTLFLISQWNIALSAEAIVVAYANTIEQPVTVSSNTITTPVVVDTTDTSQSSAGVVATPTGKNEHAVVTASGNMTQSQIASDIVVNGLEKSNNQSFATDDVIDISLGIAFDPQDQNKDLNIYVVALYEGEFFMKDSSGNWQLWDGDFATLQSYRNIKSSNTYNVNVVEGLSGLAGSFDVFVGYKNSFDELIYNSTPLTFTVQ